MKRRSFLKGVLGAPAAVAVTRLEAFELPEPEPWSPAIHEYGNFGILKIQVIGKAGLAEALVREPYTCWLDKCEKVWEGVFSMTMPEWNYSNRPTEEPPTLCVPCNELSEVEFRYDGIITYIGKPKWQDDGWFEPWMFMRGG